MYPGRTARETRDTGRRHHQHDGHDQHWKQFKLYRLCRARFFAGLDTVSFRRERRAFQRRRGLPYHYSLVGFGIGLGRRPFHEYVVFLHGRRKGRFASDVFRSYLLNRNARSGSGKFPCDGRIRFFGNTGVGKRRQSFVDPVRGDFFFRQFHRLGFDRRKPGFRIAGINDRHCPADTRHHVLVQGPGL